MSETDEGGSSNGILGAVINPGPTLSLWFFGIGAWMILLGILNVLSQVHPSGKVDWVGYLSLGTFGTVLSGTDGFMLIGDGVFLGTALILIGLGAKGINTNVDGGMVAWLKSLVLNEYWPALMNAEDGGWRRTFSAWLLAIGLVFYFYWGLVHTAWIDPGAYAVTAALVGFGLALMVMPSEDGDRALMD